MKTIGIGGAGSKIAVKLDQQCAAVNISEIELSKIPTSGEKIQASLHDGSGVFQGARMDPAIGLEAYSSVSRQLSNLVRGAMVISATGGGTGNGITTGILRDLVARQGQIPVEEKTVFALVLPYGKMEPDEFVSNTSAFLNGPVAEAIDSGNTGNIFMFSNRVKFEKQLAEDKYNQMMVNSLREFFAIPEKNAQLKLLEEHIDQADFALFLSKPYFNHFTAFNFNPENDFGKQLNNHWNPLLLEPEQAIEALFLLEVPAGNDGTCFYDILKYFNDQGVKPLYSVVENPALKGPRVSVSLLYSRKPAEEVQSFNRESEEHAQTKVRRTIDQYVTLEPLQVNLDSEADKVKSNGEDDIIKMLKRINKL
ncbi:MAG: hypothetical protein IKR13_03670 [Victivallales bacterium]|nr:hypothetical protein [Victivallales bacterium]